MLSSDLDAVGEADAETPSIAYQGIKKLFAATENTYGDALRVENVTPKNFARILKAREKSYYNWRFFFSVSHQLLIVGMSATQCELAADEIGWQVKQNIRSMGLEHELISARRTTFGAESAVQAAGSAEAHGSFTTVFAIGGLRAWPMLVVEIGMALSVADLRLKAVWWLEQSDYAVKVVLLVKTRGSSIDGHC